MNIIYDVNLDIKILVILLVFEEAIQNNIEGKVYAYFVIDKNGDVVNITTRDGKNTEVLKIAAKNLVDKLPKFKPAIKNNLPINVKYNFPVNFRLN